MFQRPTPDLRMVVVRPTRDDHDRLLRANDGDTNMINHPHWLPVCFVRLTNYGDGTAHDIKLAGDRCRPRVWLADSGVVPNQGKPPEVHYPQWATEIAQRIEHAVPLSMAAAQQNTAIEVVNSGEGEISAVAVAALVPGMMTSKMS